METMVSVEAPPYETFGDFIADAIRIAHEDGVSLSALLSRTAEILKMQNEPETEVVDMIEKVAEKAKRYPKCVACENDSHPCFGQRCENCYIDGVMYTRSLIPFRQPPAARSHHAYKRINA